MRQTTQGRQVFPGMTAIAGGKGLVKGGEPLIERNNVPKKLNENAMDELGLTRHIIPGDKLEWE